MKILPSFTHHQVVPNLDAFLSSAEHKRTVTKQLMGQTVDFHSIFSSINSMQTINCLVTT